MRAEVQTTGRGLRADGTSAKLAGLAVAYPARMRCSARAQGGLDPRQCRRGYGVVGGVVLAGDRGDHGLITGDVEAAAPSKAGPTRRRPPPAPPPGPLSAPPSLSGPDTSRSPTMRSWFSWSASQLGAQIIQFLLLTAPHLERGPAPGGGYPPLVHDHRVLPARRGRRTAGSFLSCGRPGGGHDLELFDRGPGQTGPVCPFRYEAGRCLHATMATGGERSWMMSDSPLAFST